MNSPPGAQRKPDVGARQRPKPLAGAGRPGPHCDCLPAMDSFHTQHAPFGAFASFTLGLLDAPGGFGQSLGGPPRQNVYIGVRQAPDQPWRMLPFFEPKASTESAFLGAGAPTAGADAGNFETLHPPRFRRSLGWASDRWLLGPLVFKLCTPFGRVPDPSTLDPTAARLHFAPLVCGYLEYDNTHSEEPVEVMFGVGLSDRPWRPLADAAAPFHGFAAGRDFADATPPSPEITARQGFSPFTDRSRDATGLHRLGSESALLFTIPAHQKRVYPLVLAFFRAGPVTTGLECDYFYTRHFTGLEDVLAHGFAHHAHYLALAAQRDTELLGSKLSRDQQFLLLQATHSYLGSTQLLACAGRPLWCVNEGEYRMLNTLDLTVDHLFWELEWHPWTVRNTLDLFVERYSYRDTVHAPDGRTADGGLAFAHDMGVADQFSPAGRSSYECRGLTGCFSHMTSEQLLNWIVCAVCYAQKTGDHAWLAAQRRVLTECVSSLHHRDDPDPAKRDGLIKWDSDRCGPHGAEITTYDSLDASLGQARHNLYLGVKTLAAWLLLERAFHRLGEAAAANDAGATADRLAATLSLRFETDTGVFPAVFEGGNHSRILPAIEGLVYPLYLGMTAVLTPGGRFGLLLEQLGQHVTHALQPGVCLDSSSGGWKLSSTSHNTWFSKIAIAQYVIRKLFPHALNPQARNADAVHARWQKQPGCGAFAMCDQIHSATGAAIGSRYYPRGVTTILWLQE